MQTMPASNGSPASISQWSRLVGISLRPWSGHSPLSLVLKGVIRLAIAVFLLGVVLRFKDSTVPTATEAEFTYLRNLGVLVVVALGVIIALSAVRILVGLIDLAPRRAVTGSVLSVRERRVADFLPRYAQRAIFTRNAQGIDRRRWRTEVVLDTAQGPKQGTVRNRRVLAQLREGEQVELLVSPLVGYVAKVTPVQSA